MALLSSKILVHKLPNPNNNDNKYTAYNSAQAKKVRIFMCTYILLNS